LAGKLDLDDLVSRRYGLDEINEAFRAMLDGEVARGLIVF
jgi:Zn-dependent alcohol dehydrogenase